MEQRNIELGLNYENTKVTHKILSSLQKQKLYIRNITYPHYNNHLYKYKKNHKNHGGSNIPKYIECPTEIKKMYLIELNIANIYNAKPYVNMTELYICNNNITELINLPNKLRILDCSSNKQLTSLQYLPKSLNTLISNYNNIEKYDKLPVNLQLFSCNYNTKLTQLSHLPNKLKYLYCGFCNITDIEGLPNTINILECNNNNISRFEYLPPNIFIFNCSSNNIEEFKSLPTSLLEFNCSFNKLHCLNNLPKYITSLICNNNPNLYKIDKYPINLNELNCSKTNIKTIDSLPLTIKDLNISYTEISELVVTPNLVNLSLNKNQIIKLINYTTNTKIKEIYY